MKKPETPSLEVRTITNDRPDHERLQWHFYSRGIVDVMPSYEGDGLPIGKPNFDGGSYLPSYDNFYMTFEAEYVLGKCFEVLHEVPVPTSEGELRKLLRSDFKDKILEEHWEEIEAEIRWFDEEEFEEDDFEWEQRKEGFNQSLLLAIWADLTCEPLSTPWLAAMALHAFYVADAPFTAGYMCALIDMQEKHEADAIRGKGTVENASKGGKTISDRGKPYREGILAEMRKLIDQGWNVSDAGRIAHRRGFGSNGKSNAKMWSRYGNTE